MEFQEYPKCLYQSADVYRIAVDADEEAAHRADGFMDHAELQQEVEVGAGDEPAEGDAPAEPAAPKRTRGPNKAK